MPKSPPPTPIAHYAHPDTTLRLRFWFGRRLRDEVWLDAAEEGAGSLAESVAGYHKRLADLADAAQVPWMVEVFDPAAPEDHAYMRFGTDAEAMVDPKVVDELPVPPWPRGHEHSGPLPRYDDDEPTQP